jgi:hypothetical protein
MVWGDIHGHAKFGSMRESLKHRIHVAGISQICHGASNITTRHGQYLERTENRVFGVDFGTLSQFEDRKQVIGSDNRRS